MIAFKGGQVVDEFLGFLPEHQIRAFLDRLVPSEADRLAQKGKALEKTKSQLVEHQRHDQKSPALRLIHPLRLPGNLSLHLGASKIIGQFGPDRKIRRFC